MIELSKKSLAFILVVAILIGCGGTIFAIKQGFFGSQVVSKEVYDDYINYVEKYSKLEYIREFIEANYYTDVDESKFFESVYHGAIGSLEDKYSEYIPAKDYAEYIESLYGTATYGGVGITFSIQPLEKGFSISAVNSKGPAYALGVRKGDIIATLNGEPVIGLTGDELRDSLRGEAGTDVRVGFYRGDSYYEVTITRENIATESVTYEMLEDKIAYIAISTFIKETGDDFKEALKKAESEGAVGLVIDLRDNGGGLVSSCINIANQLMNQGVVVSTLDHDGKKESYKTQNGRTDLKYIVLVNGNTASASEILSIGIQENGEGKILGTKTYGKGIIQNTVRFSDGSAVKYTEYQYLSPNGNPIHKVGVTPDYLVELDESCFNENGVLIHDKQLEKALTILKGRE